MQTEYSPPNTPVHALNKTALQMLHVTEFPPPCVLVLGSRGMDYSAFTHTGCNSSSLADSNIHSMSKPCRFFVQLLIRLHSYLLHFPTWFLLMRILFG